MCLLELPFSDLAPQRVDQSDLVSKSGEHVSRHAEHENTLSVKTEKQSEKRSSTRTDREREREREYRKREEMTIRYSAYEIHVMMRRSEVLMINDDDDDN